METPGNEINPSSRNGESGPDAVNPDESNEPKLELTKLRSWLNGSLKVKMTDGRVLIGNFFCTDRDSNIIMGSSGEYLNEEDVGNVKPRILGLVMVPGRHIVSIHYLTIPSDLSCRLER